MYKHLIEKPTLAAILTKLNYIYYLAILLFMAAILATALYIQFLYNEIPCPLCLLQRASYFAICFGVFLNLRYKYSTRYDGLIQLATVVLLIISSRQTLLDIYPRPGHEYVGTAILDLHMPVWSIVISVILLIIYSIKYCVFGDIPELEAKKIESFSKLKIIANFLMWLIIILSGINLVAIFLQCGLGGCHTFGYKLLTK